MEAIAKRPMGYSECSALLSAAAIEWANRPYRHSPFKVGKCIVVPDERDGARDSILRVWVGDRMIGTILESHPSQA